MLRSDRVDAKITGPVHWVVIAACSLMPVPKASPNLNGRCERFIETIKLECLNKFIVFGKRHFDHLVAQFVDYYNHQRSHTERDHLPPICEAPDEVETLTMDQIEVKSYVGGLVKGVQRRAA